ncbi:MAG: hypothetical protein ATN36_07670 [Epulopiscium sp. Nele67-Bin005]|nr:MAG: hypothetical protein ATN36_07670 [Epulopiscium sp. Nele67-Bin005]
MENSIELTSKRKFSTQDIVKIGMLASVCMLATFIKVPVGTAMVHLGSAALFTIGILFGGVYGGLAGAIGSALYDIVGAYSAYTLWSFFIKGGAGFLVGFVANHKFLLNFAKSKGQTGEIIKNIIAIFVAGAWTLAGYLVAWSFVLGGFDKAVLNIPASLLSSGIGLIVAIPLTLALKKPLRKFLK